MTDKQKVSLLALEEHFKEEAIMLECHAIMADFVQWPVTAQQLRNAAALMHDVSRRLANKDDRNAEPKPA